jgi:putative endonuclease
MTKARQKGKNAENLASNYLREHGYQLITANYHIYGAEVDIIAVNQATGALHIIEVKYRATIDHSIFAVAATKLARMIKASEDFINKNTTYSNHDISIDIIAVDHLGSIEHLQNISLL